MAKSMKPGGGGRFAAMVASGKSPALAAFLGRKKYGKKKFQSFAAKGKKRAGKKKKGYNFAKAEKKLGIVQS